MQPFKLYSAPLEGRTLIEAGAGTGKTYTLAGLVLRLIVEQGLGIEQILVVTYTKAATEELKTRIRSRLSAARHAFEGRPAEDDSLALLVERSPDGRAARRRLADALTNFDRAAIFTIHGFCQRLLQNFAFETGHLFQSELQQDRDPLVQEMVADFWRRYVTHAPYELARHILQQLKGPEQLGRIIAYCAYPDIKVLPEGIKPVLSAVAPWRKAAERLQRRWSQSGDSIVHLLKDPGLNARYYGKCEPDPEQPTYTHRQLRLLEWSAYLDQWNGKYPLEEKRVKYLGASLLKKYTKKGQVTPVHPFFDACDDALAAQARMEDQLARYLRYLKVRLLEQARAALDRKKRPKNILFFDDLLLHIHSALKGAHGGALAQAIRHQYRVALVDEFQDTDPVQCEIFQRLFNRPPMMLFMIGDPKQAIYSFRGADLFSYLKAADTADRSATLTRNWRSTPALVQAVNALFEAHARPFGYEQIRYHCATAARQDAAPDPAAMTLWYLTRTQGEAPSKPISQEDATAAIAAAVAEETVRLLNAPQKKIEPWQIAVLTRTHLQSQIIKGALSRRRVPAVLHSAGSVFETLQADALQRVLEAAADPHDPRKVRAALAQDMFGLGAADFHEGMEGESPRWQERWTNVYQDHRMWLRHGVYPMLRALMAREKVRSHLLSLPDGERTLTNVLHLAELLHQAEREHGLGPEGVVKWLAEQRQSAQQDDEKQLRLESDADAVRIITMHKSKGLQFDVVFCPFTWSPIRTDKAAALFHDASDEERWTLRLGPDIPPEDQLQAHKELLSENLRMLYVALTRARERCYLAWGRINGTELSAPAYLIHGSGTPSQHGDWLTPLSKKMKALTDAHFITELDRLSRRSKGTIRIAPLPRPAQQVFNPPEKAHKTGRRRTLQRTIDGHRPMASFSSLTAGTHDAGGGQADRHGVAGDASLVSAEADGGGGEAFDALFGFPKGARAGLFFHDLLEHWDHTGGSPDRQAALIRSKLQVHGFDARWHPAVDRFLHQLSAKRLPGSNGTFCLSRVTMERRINEMEFYFPLRRFSAEQLKACFKKYGDANWRDAVEPRLEQIRFAPQRGFMRGFADTVFRYEEQYFLLDWKSNHLGHKSACYDPPALDKCMVEEDYFLQYHLYTVALNRLLAQKIAGYQYERHFGGVFYIFLRGITADPAENSGLYSAKPDALLVSALDDLMITGK